MNFIACLTGSITWIVFYVVCIMDEAELFSVILFFGHSCFTVFFSTVNLINLSPWATAELQYICGGYQGF